MGARHLLRVLLLLTIVRLPLAAADDWELHHGGTKNTPECQPLEQQFEVAQNDFIVAQDFLDGLPANDPRRAEAEKSVKAKKARVEQLHQRLAANGCLLPSGAKPPPTPIPDPLAALPPAPYLFTSITDPKQCGDYLDFKDLGAVFGPLFCQAIFDQVGRGTALGLAWKWGANGRFPGVDGYRVYRLLSPIERISNATMQAVSDSLGDVSSPNSRAAASQLWSDHSFIDKIHSALLPKPKTDLSRLGDFTKPATAGSGSILGADRVLLAEVNNPAVKIQAITKPPQGFGYSCFVVIAYKGNLVSPDSKPYCLGKDMQCGTEDRFLHGPMKERKLEYLWAVAAGVTRLGTPIPSSGKEAPYELIARAQTGIFPWTPGVWGGARVIDLSGLFHGPRREVSADCSALRNRTWPTAHWSDRDKSSWWKAEIECGDSNLDYRVDGADFAANGWIRFLYLNAKSPMAPAWVRTRVEEQLLNFDYWVDENDSKGRNNMRFWSENHQILFATAEYLAGQYFRDRQGDVTFTQQRNDAEMDGAYHNVTAQEHMDQAGKRINWWLNDRLRFGFSEWNSPDYYEEDIAALFNLVDFAADLEIYRKASMVLDLVIFDLARFSQNGSFGVTAGRAYADQKVSGWYQTVGELSEILFGRRSGGQGVHYHCEDTPTRDKQTRSCWIGTNTAAAALATSQRYCVPSALLDIGGTGLSYHPTSDFSVDRSRVSIAFDEARQYGIGVDNFADGMFWWGHGAYGTKWTINTTKRMIAAYGLQDNPDFSTLNGLLGLASNSVTADIASTIAEGMALTKANLYTYSNGDVMLSSVQSWRQGQVGYQVHPWQATFDNDAAVWTTYPVMREDHDGPNWWTGSGAIPRIVQHENAAIIEYAAPVGCSASDIEYKLKDVSLTHVWFPKAAFDEIYPNSDSENAECKQRAGQTDSPHCRWYFARKGRGYIGLHSEMPCEWLSPAYAQGNGLEKVLGVPGPLPELTKYYESAPYDLVCGRSERNIFTVQVGNETEFRSFARFKSMMLENGGRTHAKLAEDKSFLDSIGDAISSFVHDVANVFNDISAALCHASPGVPGKVCDAGHDAFKAVNDNAPRLVDCLRKLKGAGTLQAPTGMEAAYSIPDGTGGSKGRLELRYDDPAGEGGFPGLNQAFPRFDNPYAHVEWGAENYTIKSPVYHYELSHNQATSLRWGDGITR